MVYSLHAEPKHSHHREAMVYDQANHSPTESISASVYSDDTEVSAGFSTFKRTQYLKDVAVPQTNNELLVMRQGDNGRTVWESYQDPENNFNEFAFHKNGLIYANEQGDVHRLAPSKSCRIRVAPTVTVINEVQKERMSHWNNEKPKADEEWNGIVIRNGVPLSKKAAVTTTGTNAPKRQKSRNAEQVLDSYDFESDPSPYTPPKKTRKAPLNVSTKILNNSIIDDAENNSSLSQSPLMEMPSKYRLGGRDKSPELAYESQESSLDGYTSKPLSAALVSKDVYSLIEKQRNDFDAQLSKHHRSVSEQEPRRKKIAPSAKRNKVPEDALGDVLKTKNLSMYGNQEKSRGSYDSTTSAPATDDTSEIRKKDQEIERLRKELAQMKMVIAPNKSHENRIDTGSSTNSIANDGEIKEEPIIEELDLTALDNHPMNQKSEEEPKKKSRFMCFPRFGKKKNKKTKNIEAIVAPGAAVALPTKTK
jgi:hypothetical protein